MVHRLDRQTTGAMVIARTREAARLLHRGFQNKHDVAVDKVYWAFVAPAPKVAAGKCVDT